MSQPNNTMKDPHTCIPIGVDCSASHYLRARGLRKEAFPFDWNVTPVLSAIRLIENGFEGFLDEEDLLFLPPTRRILFEENGVDVKETEDIITPVVCRRYGILFPHDFSERGPADLPDVRRKYARRIDRLREIIESPRERSFVFHVGDLNEWQLQQYRLAGIEVEDVSEEQVREEFGKSRVAREKLISLESLRARRSPVRFVRHLLARGWRKVG